MGGMLAPRIDAEGGNFDGLIIMAGSLRNFEQILKVQFADMLSQSKGIKKWILEKQTAKIMKGFENLLTISDDEAKKRKFGNGVTMYYFKEMESFKADDYLKNCEKPVLIIQGDKDFQCKAEIDFALYKNLLKDRENVSFHLYENLNHCFVPAIYDSIAAGAKEYKTERHIGENVITDIANWIKEA